jgi:hypothetical protein
MSDTTDLIFIFLAWMLLDLISLITFKKPVKEPRNWKKRIQLKSIITKKHLILSLVIEIIGVIFVIYSFSIPWYYHLFRYVGGGYHFQKLYFIEADSLYGIFTILLYYSYLIGLAILFVKISFKKKIRSLILLELGETILIFPGIMLIFSVQFGSPYCYLLIFSYIQSGYSSGFIIYTIGITVLTLNGLQFSVYSRFFQR